MPNDNDRISEIKAEFEQLVVSLQRVTPPQRASTELQVLQEIRKLAKWVGELRFE